MRAVHQAVASTLRDRFNRVAARVTSAVGSPFVLGAAVALIVAWAVTGPFFGFSETWQLVINTATTIITFLMVFVIQASQNRDSKAIHLKLDEVIRAHGDARNEMIRAEQSTEAEFRRREDEFLRIAREASAAALRVDAADPDASDEDVVRRAARSPSVRKAVRSAARTTTRPEAGGRATARSRAKSSGAGSTGAGSGGGAAARKTSRS